MFKGNSNYVDNHCLRCRKTVYPTDKIGKPRFRSIIRIKHKLLLEVQFVLRAHLLYLPIS